MKNIKFSLILIAAALVITASSCTTSQVAADENAPRGRQVGNRIYLDDPYAGTIVLERDPYTGRYYDVTYGQGGLYGYNPYYNSRYNDPYYNRGMYGGRRVVTQPRQQQPTEQQKREYQQNREEARRKVLGN